MRRVSLEPTDVREEWRREHKRNPLVRAAVALARLLFVPRWCTRAEFDAEVDKVLGMAPHEMDAEHRRAQREVAAMLRRHRRPPGDAA